MKQFLLISLLIFSFTLSGFSQDTIRVKDGRILLCKIIHVDSLKIDFTIEHNERPINTSINRSEVIKYSIKHDYQSSFHNKNNNTPNINLIYPITDSIVLSENGKIITKNGRMLDFKEFKDTLKSNETAYKYATKAFRNFKTSFYFSLYGSGVAGYGLGYALGTTISGKPIDWTLLGVFEVFGLGIIYLGKPFKHKGIQLTRKAVMEYNRNKRSTSLQDYYKPKFELHFKGNQIGIALKLQ